MNGKQLRELQRKAMYVNGGLVFVKDETGRVRVERTMWYQPLKRWLSSQENSDVRKSIKDWRTRKRAQR